MSFEVICVLSGVTRAALDAESCLIFVIVPRLAQSAQIAQKIATFFFFFPRGESSIHLCRDGSEHQSIALAKMTLLCQCTDG